MERPYLKGYLSKEAWSELIGWFGGPVIGDPVGGALADMTEDPGNPHMDEMRARARTMAGRTLGGAAVGATAMSLLPGDQKRRLVRALIGAAGGGVIGAASTGVF